MKVRQAHAADLEAVMMIYEHAREAMRSAGNPDQWAGDYPSRRLIGQDISAGHCYVVEDGREIAGVFSFIIGEDPTYGHIEGQWLNCEPYGAIHRLAAAPAAKGIADACLEFCRGRGVDIRIDTHKDNAPMLGWLHTRGFAHCGTIYCDDGTPRKAFQLPFSPSSPN